MLQRRRPEQDEDQDQEQTSVRQKGQSKATTERPNIYAKCNECDVQQQARYIYDITTIDVQTFILTNLPGSYTCQIFWNGDDSLEDFTIRFPTEEMAQKWYAKFQEQRQAWIQHARASAQPRVTSRDFTALQMHGAPRVTSREFMSMQGQNLNENPYRRAEEEQDDVDTNTVTSGTSYSNHYPSLSDSSFGTGLNNAWNNSQTTLRSRAGTGDSSQVLTSGTGTAPIPMPPPSRTAPPRLPLGSIVAPVFNPDLPPAAQFADSYFSPTEESPLGFSSRTSSSSGMYPFPRQGHFSEGGFPPASMPYRAGSRETMNQAPSLATTNLRQAARPAYQSGSGVPSTLSTTRNRSVSSPNMNEAQRRTIDNAARPPMPDGATMTTQQYSHSPHPSIPRTYSNYSPNVTSGIDERMGAASPPVGVPMSYSPVVGGGYPMLPSKSAISHFDNAQNTSRFGSPALMSTGTPVMGADSLPAAQLKIKVHAPAANQVLTLVVPANIAYQSLKDRIDAKLQRSTNLSLTDRGQSSTVRLKYLDEDDLINIGCDEDVQTAFETWREQKGDVINGLGEIELYCQ